MDKNSLHFKGTYRNVYEVNRAYPNGGVDGDYVDINGWQHWWNPDRGTWCVNENRDSYWDEVLSTVQNLLFSKACVSESDFPLNPTDEEKRFGYFYNGELYLWTGTNGTVRNGQYRSFGVVQGERGVGVSSIAQTSTSNVDGGKNEITVTLTNGDSYKFFTYNGTGRNKGYYYRTLDELKQAVPSPTVTDWAIVDGSVYVCDEAGVWKDTTYSWKPIKLNPFVTELNKMDMPTSTGYLYWNGQSFGWKTPVVNNGGGNTGGGTSIDLSEYSWWGRKFDPASKSITGEMSSVTGIEFQSTNGETVIRKKLHLDKNGDLYFDGNLYATGGITALGSGGSTSGGGSGADLKTLEVLNKNGSTFFAYNGKTGYRLRFGSGLSMDLNVDEYVVTANGGTGTSLSSVMSAMNSQLGKTSYGTPQFLYWNGSTYTWKNESEISGSGGAGSIQVAQTPEYSGESESWVSATKLRFVGITGTKPTIRTNSEKSCVDVGIPVGGGSGSSGTTSGKLRFYKDSSEESWNGESDFKIIFGSGLNVTWDSHSQITLSATGGSSTGGSVDLSSYLTKTEASITYAAKSHTHSVSDIPDFTENVKTTKVNNATNADKANKLTAPVYLWGNSFSGIRNIGSSTSNKADLRYVNNIYTGDTFGLYNTVNGTDTSLLSIDNTPNISVAYGYRTNKNAILSLFGNKTKIYTNGQDYHFDFVKNVFDVNTNAIHFGSGASGGKISWDAANNAFKIEGNVYATGGITALGVSNNATTSNNVDFTFGSVTSKRNIIYADDNVPFKIYPKNNTKAALLFSYNGKNWSIYDDNYEDLYLQDECHIDSDGWIYSPQFLSNENGSMSLDGSSFYLGDEDNSVNVIFYYNGSRYKLDMSKAISGGVFATLSTQELSALQERKTKKKAVL